MIPSIEATKAICLDCNYGAKREFVVLIESINGDKIDLKNVCCPSCDKLGLVERLF